MKPKLLFLLSLLPLFSMCRQITIKGNVINKEGKPIPAATISIKGTTNATIANNEGEFTLTNTAPYDTLIVAAAGYQTTAEPNNQRGLVAVMLNRKTIALQVGDTMPDILLANLINYPVSEIQLSAVNKQLVLLDFWATTCASCLKSFPTLDSLQAAFAKEIQVFLVNPKRSGDDTASINRMLQKAVARFGKPINLPIVVGDTAAFQLFGFTSVPHYVWIDEHRVIRAITDKKSITPQAVKAMLQGMFIYTSVNSTTGQKQTH